MEQSAVAKVFRLLEELGNYESSVPLHVLARASEMPKATAHRALQKMCELGYVERSQGGSYQLTSKIRSLSAPSRDRRLLMAAETVLEKLHKQLGETVNLGVLRDGGVAYLRVLETTQSLRRVVKPDCVDPFHCTALGRAMVAHLPEDTIKSLLAQSSKLVKLTSETVVDPVRILEILEDTRRLGYAVERDETDVGVTCVGAPIFMDGKIAGALSLSAPSARLRGGLENDAIRAVKQAAATVTAAISKTE